MPLSTHNIVDRNSKTYRVFQRYITNDFINDPTLMGLSSSLYVQQCWQRYQANYPNPNNSLNGNIFEAIIASELFRQGIAPFYLQATVTFVPNVNYDIIIFDTARNIPISLSLKTSVRERYKQADLEAVALKYVHRNAKNYLVMLDQAEANSLKRKLANGDLLGIDDIIQADTNDFDNLVTNLRSLTPGYSPQFYAVQGKIT